MIYRGIHGEDRCYTVKCHLEYTEGLHCSYEQVLVHQWHILTQRSIISAKTTALNARKSSPMFNTRLRKRISAVNIKLCCFSMNCIVWIKPLKLHLQEHPHSIAFQDVIALYFFIIRIHTNVQRFPVHLPAKTSRVAIFLCKVTSLFE